ncbi:isopenicillin N synthase family oxygenase [Mycolicibacterium mucogenicum]|uniref:isopenicillin N synthase family dioxygenase n=1 Tax=Mycolicibacterium TaxID=1866885 RepID=UPI00226A2E96|nr:MULTISPECIES: 2-oxoglutarate and iron-dependent oxygenase domain-containing protein [Mycolicibacterium]MCX8560940.1 isopenicillin N synthase family oxygenase [Mycolicibacterium mucogenicum]
MTTFTVPRIDIAPYLDPAASKDADPACAAVAARIDAACAGVGFLQVVGHGIPADAIDGLAAAIDQFFGAPTEFKRTLRRPGENRGYTPPKSESLSMSLGVAPANAMNDFYEAFTLGTEATAYPHADLPVDDYPDNSWPDLLGFRDAVETYFREVTVLSRALLRACSDALGLGTGYFDHLVDHSIDTLKMNNYALAPGAIELDGPLTGMGAHTDFGILTVLWADQVPGLEVLGADSVWHPVQPDPGAFLINLGDAFARWTNDRWRSTLHRVDPPVVDGRIERRRSAAFFLDGNHDAVIEPLPGTVEPGAKGYPPITVAAHLQEKLAGMKTGRAPAGADREAARLLGAQS